jgi:hypothetical protein
VAFWSDERLMKIRSVNKPTRLRRTSRVVINPMFSCEIMSPKLALTGRP